MRFWLPRGAQIQQNTQKHEVLAPPGRWQKRISLLGDDRVVCQHSLSPSSALLGMYASFSLISLLLNGEVMPKLLMTVIRFCVPCDDHKIKKLLLVYWEVVEKTGPDGKLLPEMILVCNNLRNDLSHPNEYIRGCTLRFLCKLKEAEILEPLIPTIKNNLEHRHSFVRRNGVLAVFAIFKSFDYLLPDGPELVEKVLQTVRHGDSSVRLKGAAATASSRELPPHRNLTLRASATPSSCSSRRRKSAPLLFFPKISTR